MNATCLFKIWKNNKQSKNFQNVELRILFLIQMIKISISQVLLIWRKSFYLYQNFKTNFIYVYYMCVHNCIISIHWMRWHRNKERGDKLFCGLFLFLSANKMTLALKELPRTGKINRLTTLLCQFTNFYTKNLIRQWKISMVNSYKPNVNRINT